MTGRDPKTWNGGLSRCDTCGRPLVWRCDVWRLVTVALASVPAAIFGIGCLWVLACIVDSGGVHGAGPNHSSLLTWSTNSIRFATLVALPVSILLLLGLYVSLGGIRLLGVRRVICEACGLRGELPSSERSIAARLRRVLRLVSYYMALPGVMLLAVGLAGGITTEQAGLLGLVCLSNAGLAQLLLFLVPPAPRM